MASAFTVPRKHVLAALAGAAALSAAPLTLAARSATEAGSRTPAFGSEEIVAASRRNVGAAFAAVRAAKARVARSQAFLQLKSAIIANEHAERMLRSLASSAEPPGGLYQSPDAVHALARALVAELENAPSYDRRWLQRLGRLEVLLRDEVMA